MNSKLDGQPLNFLLCYWQTKGKKTKDNLILNFTHILYSLYYWLHFCTHSTVHVQYIHNFGAFLQIDSRLMNSFYNNNLKNKLYI